MSSYLFILCPPYSGSTVLWKLVSTSNAVSSLPKEGQFLPEVKEVMRKNPWRAEVKLPWAEIKEVWDRYWDHSKPLLVEKSPPHLIRTDEIVRHFNPVHFLVMVRNPYAHCEGLMRRSNWDVIKAAEFTVLCLRRQAENAKKLSSALCFTYEELVESPAAVAGKIQSFLPQLGALNPGVNMNVWSIDGKVERGIVDLNQKKVSNLSFRDITRINQVLRQHSDIMDHWGYRYYEPSLGHAFAFFRTRSSLFFKTVAVKLARRLGRKV